MRKYSEKIILVLLLIMISFFIVACEICDNTVEEESIEERLASELCFIYIEDALNEEGADKEALGSIYRDCYAWAVNHSLEVSKILFVENDLDDEAPTLEDLIK